MSAVTWVKGSSQKGTLESFRDMAIFDFSVGEEVILLGHGEAWVQVLTDEGWEDRQHLDRDGMTARIEANWRNHDELKREETSLRKQADHLMRVAADYEAENREIYEARERVSALEVAFGEGANRE